VKTAYAACSSTHKGRRSVWKSGCPSVRRRCEVEGEGSGPVGILRVEHQKIFTIIVCANVILGIFLCLCERLKVKIRSTIHVRQQ